MRSRIDRRSLAATPLLAVAIIACADDGESSDTNVLTTDFVDDGPGDDATGLQGVGTTGGGGGNDGLDDTGDDGSGYSPFCLYDPDESGNIGHRYQCAGSVELDILVHHGFGGSPEPAFFKLSFGPGVDGDGYDNPLVMACCPLYDAGAPNCEQPHERACFVDLVEQGCKSMVAKIEDFAHDQFPGLLDVAKRKAVLKIADHVRSHQGDCWAAFRDDTGITSMPATCDENNNGVNYTAMLEDGAWSFDPDGAVDLVEISVAQAEWHGLFPYDAEDGVPADCISADDNDGVMFLEIDPASGAKVVRLQDGRVDLHGPGVEGVGQLATSSVMAIAPSSLENLALHSAGPAVVQASEAMVPVDAFHVRLWDRAMADVEGHTLTVRSGDARFAVSAIALGRSAVRTATNATPIVITRGADGWRTSAFSVAYLHDGETWSLAVAPARWQ